jgi:cytochrome bd ubiquinol oxidase subunit II
MAVATLFFCFLALLLAGYVVLDGYDLGTGILHLRLAKNDAERQEVLATIGPLWDGNEVFLIAAGGTLFFAFPALYAASFSGFYLPLMIVLWLLMIRGVSVEVRSHVPAPQWRDFFDVAFSLSSLLLAFVLGVALGNVVRGVPVGADRVFLLPLWTNLLTGPQPGILDWYTMLVGATAVVAIAEHGALWVALRAAGPVRERAREVIRPLWRAALVLTVAMSAASFAVQPRLVQAMAAGPWRLAFPVAGALASLAVPVLVRRGRAGLAFAAWSLFLSLLLATAAFGLYPWVLPSSLDPALSLTIDEVKAADASLRIGATWWPVGVGLAIVYTGYVHWRFAAPSSSPAP